MVISRHRILRHAATIGALFGCLQGGIAAAEPAASPRIYTNQAYVEDAIAAPRLAIGDPLAVFAFVLASLPERVKVFPTENYYYFAFVHDHTRYAGNLRLDVVDRDQGMVHFAYYEDLAEWKDEEEVNHVVLDRRRGVTVEKVAPLLYRVSYGTKSVMFELNDLSGVKPPAGAIGPDETFLGPIFDESAIRFFLVFNRSLKAFHYILDETIDVSDKLVPVPDVDRILIGKRTGFAFYRDHKLDRKILIGVFEGNSRVNNYFDGPFDQLPDNFIEGETLREAILAAEPQLKGEIDRYGISPGGNDRYLIAPYRHYRTDDDLLVFHTCATSKRIPAARYYDCFVFDDDQSSVRAEIRAPSPKRRSRPGNAPAKRP
jgi:hypothetical protein